MNTFLRDYRLSLQTEGKSPATVKWYLPFLGRFRHYLEREVFPTSVDRIDRLHVRAFIGHLQSEATVPHTGAPLSPPAVPEQPVDVLSDDDIESLLRACPRSLSR